MQSCSYNFLLRQLYHHSRQYLSFLRETRRHSSSPGDRQRLLVLIDQTLELVRFIDYMRRIQAENLHEGDFRRFWARYQDHYHMSEILRAMLYQFALVYYPNALAPVPFRMVKPGSTNRAWVGILNQYSPFSKEPDPDLLLFTTQGDHP